jgi:hypothetical protein
MAQFSRSAPRPQTAGEFVDGADAPSTPARHDTNTNTSITADAHPTSKRRRARVSRERPWERFSKKATAKGVFNLRLNDYYLSILRHLAAQDEDKSMQQIVKAVLLPELERMAGIASDPTRPSEDI